MTIVTCRNPADIRREAKLAAKRAAPRPGADIVPHPVIASTPHHLKLTDGELEALTDYLVETVDVDRVGKEEATLLRRVMTKARLLQMDKA